VSCATTIRLGDVCEKIGSGATPRGGSEVYLSSGTISFIRSQNVYNSHFNRDGLVYLTDRHAADLSNVEVKAGDVLLNITGDSVARCCEVPADVLPARVSQHVAIIRPNAGQLDSRYLRLFLVSPTMQEHMLQLAGAGATRNALTKGMIESFQIPYRPLAEQQMLAGVLGSLDDKIDLNRRMNETLETMARSLFRSWFVDYDPVRAKVDGQHPHGLDALTASLFPASFSPGETGPIPKGWQVNSFGSVVKLLSGGTPSKANPNYWNGVIPWLSAKDMKTPRILDTEDHVTAEGAENGTRLVEAGTTLVLVRGMTLHNDVPICLAARSLTFNQDVKAVVSKNPEHREYVYLWLLENKPALMGLVDAASHGTGRIHTDLLTKQVVVVPPSDILNRFNAVVRPLIGRATANDHESIQLAALRDTLLPKLLSGELRVKEAERLVEAAS
jgi:type I restriction enzyme S subunit